MLPAPVPLLSSKIQELSRPRAAKVLQFLTGHAYLKYHFHNSGRAEDPICWACLEEEETVWHLLTECPAFKLERRHRHLRLTEHSRKEQVDDFFAFVCDTLSTYTTQTDFIE